MKAKNKQFGIKLFLALMCVLMFIITVLATNAVLAEEQHTHNYADGEWVSDGEYHWKKCAICGEENTENKHEHEYFDDICICGQHKTNLMWLMLTLAGIGLVLIVLIAIRLVKTGVIKRTRSFVGLALLGAVVGGQIPAVIILAVEVIALGVWAGFVYFGKNQPKVEQKVEQVAEEQPKQEQVAEDKPVEQVVEEKPVVVAEEKPVEQQVSEEKPVEEQPVEQQPVVVEEKPAEQVVEEQPKQEVVAEEKPVEQVVEDKPVEQVVEETPVVVAEEKPKQAVVVVDDAVAAEAAIVDSETAVLEGAKGEQVAIRFNRSFNAKLIQSSDVVKDFYCQITNYIMSHKKVKNRISWKASSFNSGRNLVAKLTIRGKTLTIHLPLEASSLDVKFKVKDMSNKKAHVKTPCAYKIRSLRGVKNAKKLIDMVIANLGLVASTAKHPVEPANYPFEDTKTLMEKGLIKVRAINKQDIATLDNLVQAPFTIHQSITVQQAKEEMTDDLARSLVVEEKPEESVVFVGAVGKKYAINIDTLSQNFNNGDLVDINVLKKRKLVPQSANAIKILARGMLDKKLTVRANDFSTDAIKMILLVGGKAIHC